MLRPPSQRRQDHPVRRDSSYRPQVESMEARRLLASFHWLNNTSGAFNVAANWQDQNGNPGVPGAGDDAAVDFNGITVSVTGSTSVNSLNTAFGSTLNVTAGNLVVASSSRVGTLDLSPGATFRVAGGTTTLIASGTIAGGFDVAAGATLSFNGSGTFDLNSGAAFTGAGLYDVAADFSVLSVNAPVTAPPSFEMDAGSLEGPATLTVPGTFTWAGGSMTGTGATTIAPTGTLAITGGAGENLNDRTINNAGATTWTGTGGFNASGTATFNNLPGATFTSLSHSNFGSNGGLVLNNAGTFTANPGAGATAVFLTTNFNNTATVNVETGTLLIQNGGTSSGVFDVAAGAALDFGSTYTIAPGAVLQGAGLYATGGFFANITLNTDVNVKNLNLTEGQVSGPGNLTITGTLNWTGGTMSGPGTTMIPAGATLAIDGSDPKFLVGRTLNNAGVTTDTGLGHLGIGPGPFNNLAGGTFNLNAATLLDDFGGPGVVNNAGTLNVNPGAGGTATIGTQTFDNTGRINLNSGTLLLAATGTDSGPVVAAPGTSLLLGSRLFPNGYIITPAATFQGGAGSTFGLLGDFAKLELDANWTVDHFEMAGGQFGGLSGSGVLTVTGEADWTTGTIGGTGAAALNIAPAATLKISGTVNKSLATGRPLNNAGTATWTDAGNIDAGVPFVINNTGTFTITGNSILGHNADAIFNNSGTLTVDPGSGPVDWLHLTLNNTGTVNVRSGRFNVDSVSQVLGTKLVGGTWSVGANSILSSNSNVVPNLTENDANVTFGGPGASIPALNTLAINAGSLTLGPGASLSVPGTFTQTAAGTLTVLLGGSPASGLAGVLHAAAGVTLGGTLALGLTNGFAPASGDQFQVVTSPNVTGAFARVVRLSPGPGQSLGARVTPTAVVVSGTGAAKPADLTVQSVTVTQTTGQPGDTATLTWTVLNKGGPALGPWEDALYLSPTPTLGAAGVLLAVVPHAADVAAGQTYTASVPVTIPGLRPGNYYAIVRVDRRDRGPNTADETGASAQPFALAPVPTLTPGTPINGRFTGPNQDRYFQITVSPGQSLRLDALSQAGTGTLEVSARLGALPTAVQSDATTAGSFGPGQVLAVPPSQGGTYFIDVHSRSGAVATSGFRLTASFPGLSLLSATPGSAGNRGPSTLAVHGTGFTPDTRFSLSGPSGSVAGGVARFVDGTLADVTFDFSGKAAGAYTLTATIPGGATATLASALSVVAGVPTAFDLNVSGPSQVRFGRTYGFQIIYTNTGNTDLPAPLLVVSNPTMTPIGTSPDSLEPSDSLSVLATNPVGPAGMLGPGQQGQVTVYFQPTATQPTFLVDYVTPDDTTPMDYATLATFIRPDGLTDARWSALYGAFQKLVGPTQGAYVAMLEQNASLLPPQDGSASDPFALDALELRFASASLGDSITGALTTTDPRVPLGGRAVTVDNTATGDFFTSVSLNDGTFVLDGLTPGPYTFTVDGAALSGSPSASVAAGQAVTGVTLALSLGGVISGTVTSAETGLPVPFPTVEASGDNGGSAVVTGAADGTYRLSGLPPDTYEITAYATGLAAQSVGGVVIGTDPATQDLILTAESVITGTAAPDPAGPTGGLLDAVAVPENVTGLAPSFPATIAGNSFAFQNLPPGTYDLTVGMDGYVSRVVKGITVGPAATADAGTVPLAPSASLSGTVVSNNPSAPPAFAVVSVFSGGSPVASTLADGSGAFSLTGVAAGTYTLVVSTSAGNSPAQSVTLAGGDHLTGLSVVIPAGSPAIAQASGIHALDKISYPDSLRRQLDTLDGVRNHYTDLIEKAESSKKNLQAECSKCRPELIAAEFAYTEAISELQKASELAGNIQAAIEDALSNVVLVIPHYTILLFKDQVVAAIAKAKRDYDKQAHLAQSALDAADQAQHDLFLCNQKCGCNATAHAISASIAPADMSSCPPPPPTPHPPPPPPPPGPGGPRPRKYTPNGVIASDPNEKTGTGFGPHGFFAPGAPLTFEVQFENDPKKATAPAQEVVVTDKLDPSLDWTTFALGDITFGSHFVAVPAGLQSYTTSVDTTNTDGTPLRVDVRAGLDLNTGVVTWTFRSIDPATGQLPTGAQDGFLPVDDATGRGLGSVFLTVRPNPGLATGAAFTNSATIVFDTNAPIVTNVVTETVDAGAPTSRVATLPAASAPRFTVRWSGTDDPGGSGIATYNVFVSTDGGPYTAFLVGTTTTSATFNGVVGHRYAFSTTAVDHVGNVQPSFTALAVTTVSNSSQAPVITLAPPGPVVAGTTLSVGGSFRSPNSGPFVVAVNYGDGTGLQHSPVGTGRTFSLSHTYARPGTYTVTVGVKDGNGVVGTTTLRLTVLASLPGSGFGAGRDAFVTTLYREDLGRTPEPLGLRYWSGILASRVAPKTVALAIWFSGEHRTLVRQHLAPAIPFDRTYADALLAGQRAALQFGPHPLGTLHLAALSRQTIRKG